MISILGAVRIDQGNDDYISVAKHGHGNMVLGFLL